jgi:hypothetical protein
MKRLKTSEEAKEATGSSVATTGNGELTRRDVIRLLGAGCLAGVAVVGLSGTAAADFTADSDAIDAQASFALLGTVSAANDRHVTILAGSASMIATPIRGARMYSGVLGRVRTPSDFILGDRVLVQGVKRADDAVSATAISSVYQPIRFTVSWVDKAAGLAGTSIGTLDLNGSLPDVGKVDHSLKNGDTLGGLTWTDPRDRQIYLVLTERDRFS